MYVAKLIKSDNCFKQSSPQRNCSNFEIIWGESVKSYKDLNQQSNNSNRIENKKQQVGKLHIGFFLGYTVYLGEGGFEGEGIGRFVIRLVEGLLYNDKSVIITIVTTDHNYSVISKAFEKNSTLFPNRLFIQKFYSMEWLNVNIPVKAWIVPYIGMKLALQLKKPIIVCLHDLVYMHFKDMYKAQQGFNDEYTSIAKKLVRKATKVVFNSYFVRDNEGLKFLKLPQEKVHVIRLAAPQKEYDSIRLYDEKVFRHKYRLYDKYIVYPSVIRFHKNHDRLIEAFLKFRQTDEGSMSNLCLVLTDHYDKRPNQNEIIRILKNCKDMSARNSIVFLGRLPWSDIPLLYKYAIGTIIPTLFEGSCPLQILESLTMDTPVAMSRIDVIKEVIPDIDAFITFDPYSLEQVQEVIKDLYRVNNVILEKQKKAISHVLKRNWSDVAREYQTLITLITGRG